MKPDRPRAKTLFAWFLCVLVVSACMGCAKGTKSESCLYYESDADSLWLSAFPGLDAEAVMRVIAATVNGRPVNDVCLCSRTRSEDPAYSETLLEPFSRLFTAPIACLTLDEPEMESGRIKDPALWRESLARMQNIEDLVLPSLEDEAGKPSFAYLYEITGGKAMFPQYRTVTAKLQTYANDLSGLELFSGMERLRLSSGDIAVNKLDAAPSLNVIELLGAGSLSTAKQAYTLRTQGFRVEGVADDPRVDLSGYNNLQDYDTFLAVQQAEAALQANSGSFEERYESMITFLQEGGYSAKALGGYALSFLEYFYSLADTPAFPAYLARLCTFPCAIYDTADYTLLLQKAAAFEEESAARLAAALPEGGDWCMQTITIEDAYGMPQTLTVLDALMQPYVLITDEDGYGEADRGLLLTAIAEKDLIAGKLMPRYFSQGPDAVFVLLKEGMARGSISASAAYALLLDTAYGEDDRADLDGMLYAMALWEKEFDTPVMMNYALDGLPLTCESDKLASTRYERVETASGTADGRTALFAYKMEDSPDLLLTRTAYMQLGNEAGARYRAIPKEQTPASFADAQLLIIAYRTYEHAFDYTDGTKGYACRCDVYAYALDTGACISHLGYRRNDPPRRATVAKHTTEVRAEAPSEALCELISGWLTDGNDREEME